MIIDKKWSIIPVEKLQVSSLDLVFSLFLLSFAVLLYWPPSEYILGGWDPGVYLASGSSILKYHSINFLDPLLESLSRQERKIFISQGFGIYEFFPGLRVMKFRESLIGPQFFHMYPTLLSLVFSIGNIQTCLAVNPVIGCVSILVIYALCRVSTESFWIPLFGAILLMANPVQIWMARFQNSEMLSQLSFLLGFLCLFCAHSNHVEGNKKWLFTTYIASALCFWISLLTRYDHLLVALPLFSIGLISIAWKKTPLMVRHARCIWTIILSTGILHTFIHQKAIAYRYYPLSNIFEMGAIVIVLASIIATLGIHFFFIQIEKIWKRFNIYLRWAAVLGVIFTAVYAAFIRPHQMLLGWERLNFVNLNSFVTILVMLLALLGISVSLLKSKRFEEGVFIIIGLFVTTIIVRNKFIDPFYLWGARRFVPVIFPFFFISACFGVKYILNLFHTRLKHLKHSSTQRWVSIALPVVLSITYLLITYPDRKDLQGYRDFYGMTNFFREISQKIPKADLIVTQERGVAEVLHFYYDQPAVYIRNTRPKHLNILQRIVIKRLDQHQRVLVLTQNENLFNTLNDLTFRTLEKFVWRGKRLNESKTGFPKGTKERGFDLLLLDVLKKN
jgi:hypothetical protein